MSIKVEKYSFIRLTMDWRYDRHFGWIFALSIVHLFNGYTEGDISQIDNRYNEISRNSEIRHMVTDLLESSMEHASCYVMMMDEYYYEIIGNTRVQNSKPYFKILVNESEDLLSPNYETIKVIQEAKKNSCNLYVVFLTNGEQAARFFTFGDRYRTIDLRARFVLMKDRRMFTQKYNVLWKKMINVLFVKQYKNTRRFELSTVPFPPPLNGPIIPYKISYWDKGFQGNKILFQDKTSNLKGQALKVVTFEHVPTTTIITIGNYSKEEEDTFTYAGLEIEVLKTLANVMNFRYAIYEPANAEEEQWGRRQTNGSFSGLLGEMLEGRADIALGNLYYTPYHLQMLDLSVPYNTECLTFLTPESLTDNSWQTLVLPFQSNMWIAVIITLFLGGFLCYIFALYHRYIENKDFSLMDSDEKMGLFRRFLKHYVKPLKEKLSEYWKKVNKKQEFLRKSKELLVRKRRVIFENEEQLMPVTFRPSPKEEDDDHEGLYIFQTLDNSILYTYGMFLQISLPKMPAGWSIRMFTGWWWIYCILVSVSYKASMTAILANPAPRVTIDTLEQLAESEDVKCGGWGEQSKEFFITSLDVTSQKVGRKFEVIYDVDSAVERVASGEFAYYQNIYFLHYLTIKHKDKNVLNRLYNETEEESIDKTKGKILHVMSNCVINMPISIGLQKNSPLKPKIDDHLVRVVEAGLVIKWLNDVMFDIRNTEAKQDTEEVKALMNLKKLYGAVAALLVGYLISVIAFIAELIMWYCVEKKRPHFDKYNLREYYMKQKALS